MSQNVLTAGTDESLDITVGRNVHMLMWERKISQTSLGRAVGIDQSSLGKRLRGERGWSLDDLRAVAAELGVSIAYLVGETQDAPVPEDEGVKVVGAQTSD